MVTGAGDRVCVKRSTVSASVEVAANSIGEKAFVAAQQSQVAQVVGAISQGLFLLAPRQQIIFISLEHHRSPLTINLDRSLNRLRAVEVGTAAQVSGTRLIFPAIEFSISLSTDAVWQCPPPIATACPLSEQRQLLQQIATGALARRNNDGLAALLPALLDLPDALPRSAGRSALLDRLIALRRAAGSGDNSAVLTGLIGLLGQGRGLTPSGDDVVIGLLLMLNRWRRDRDWNIVNRAVIEAAYRITTTISANLIECAASGQGDERLITVVDGIASGSATIDECVDCVLDWGSSSGIDALIGMAVARTAL
jgi:hypothetical protein